MASKLTLLGEGAEAKIYLLEVFNTKLIVKHRISKPYRHPLFDKLFRERRTKTEARVLSKLYSSNLPVPAPLFVDPFNSIIVMEYVPGKKLSDVIYRLNKDVVGSIAYRLGEYVGKMHCLNIYHGDLTLANILYSENIDRIFLIDFGLAGYSTDIEEYAIDIHLIERSINALAPELSKSFVESFWQGYMEGYGENAHEIKNRVHEIKLRGRYVEERLKKRLEHERYR